ncbi:MAG: ABC transporter permease, partial [Oscillospiraceae bacterium]
MDNHGLAALPGLRQNGRAKAAVWCGLLLAVVAGVFLAGAFIGEEALQINFAAKGLAPSLRYPFGTDWLGRNMLLRTVKGLS